MLFHSFIGDGANAYVGQMSCLLRGPLDVEAFCSAFTGVVARHDALNAAFVTGPDGRPMQLAGPVRPPPILIEDLRARPDEERQRRVAAYLAEDRAAPFDLAWAPLMRFALFRLADDLVRIVWTRHHAVMDGWSVNVVMDELMSWYGAMLDGAAPSLPPAPSFRGFVSWLANRDGAETDSWWRERLAGFREPTPVLPEEVLSRSAAPARSLVELSRPLGARLSSRLRELARARGVTLATVLTGAWAILVGRYSRSDDVLFGLTVSGRPDDLPDVERTVGLFVNTVPARIRVAEERPLGAWLAGLQAELAAMRRHQHAPLASLHRHTGVPQDRALFSHILVLENYPLAQAAGGGARFGDLEVEDYSFIDQTNLALNVGVIPNEDMTFLAVYDPDRLPAAAMERLASNFRTLLEAMAATPDLPVGALPVSGRADGALLAARLGGPVTSRAKDVAGHRPLAMRILDRAAAAPAAPAVLFEGTVLGYGELLSRAGVLARRLRGRGVGRETVVGVCLDRSPELVVALLGILLAGAAYLPLATDDPPDRLASLAADAAAALVVAGDRAPVFAAAGLPVLPLADLPPADLPTANLRDDAAASFDPPSCDPDQAAYLLFTSGSTGKPKGVVNTQGGLLNRLDWMQAAYPIGPGDRVLQKTPYTFDVSVWEFFWPLVQGAAIVLAAPDGHRDPAYLRDLIRSAGVTVTHFVPSMLRAFLATPGIESCTGLRRIVCSGEALPGDLRDLAHARLPASVHNLYGPTEAAIDVTYHDCTRNETGPAVPIGRPIANIRMLVLDRFHRPVPYGAVGELAIAGIGLARGYAGRPGLTAERFVPDPAATAPGERCYLTGDLARLDEDGRLIHLGRIDQQVKIRGQRIEPGEVEAALCADAEVRDAAVTVAAAGTEAARLVAHVVPAAGADRAGLGERLRARLSTRLPAHMIPARFVLHEALPALSSGKRDLNRLRALAESDAAPDATERRFDAPRDPVEETVAALWARVLDLPRVGIHENFFEIGGHSLLLTQVGLGIAEAFGVEVPLRRLYNLPTVAAMAEAVVEAELARHDPAEVERLMAEILNADGAAPAGPT